MADEVFVIEMTRITILLCLTLTITKVQAAIVKEVRAGQVAELPCPSSDDDHRFMFWLLTNDEDIIGPTNELDTNKYNYEALTGKLYIRGVSTEETGFYKCVSRGIKNIASIKIHKVQLIVRTDWDNVGESSFETNLLRAMAVIMAIVVTVAIVLFIVIMKKKRSNRFFEIEESRENSPEKFTSNIHTISMPQAPPTKTSSTFENAGLDDFPKVFQHMQK